MGSDESHFIRRGTDGDRDLRRWGKRERDYTYRYAVTTRNDFCLKMDCLKCCFTSTETVGLLGTGTRDVHLEEGHFIRIIPRGTDGDRDPRRQGKRDTVPNAKLSPPE